MHASRSFTSTAVLHSALLAGCALASSPAFAQAGPNDGDNSLHGAGTTSIEYVLEQEMDCIDGHNGSTATEPVLSTPSGLFYCSSDHLKLNFSGKYIATGSGVGRQVWRANSNQFFPTTSYHNRWHEILGQSDWQTVQFAFADSSVTASDVIAYNTNNAPTSGPGIMFPKYVLPVAIAYNSVYGKNSSGNNMTFRVTTPGPKAIGGVIVGGLKLTRELYCGIFNGQITNFNDSRFAAANLTSGGVATDLHDATFDTAARWAAQGAPIRLVGRVDKSGTTDIFTRALSVQCTGFGYTNAYARNAETLPYDRGALNLPDFTSVLSDTGLNPLASDKEAGNGTSLLVGNTYFNGTGYTTVSGGVTSQPAANSTNGSGLFMVATGSGGVRDAINFAPDWVVTSATFGTNTFNGKIGYISAAFLPNSLTGSAALFATALQAPDGRYRLPSAANAVQAINLTVEPPQSLTGGAYSGTTDTRQVRDPSDATETARINATRDNPLAWYDVMYSDTNSTLADPADGYPITGTTQFLGYTCYKPSNQTYVVDFLGWNLDDQTMDDSGATRTGIFTDATTGLLALSNIGAMPNDWQKAIRQTFLNTVAATAPLKLNIEAAGSTSDHCKIAGR